MQYKYQSKMNIRLATLNDTIAIQKLVAQLGYPHSYDFIFTKLKKLQDSTNDEVFVYEEDNFVKGLITLHFSVQLAFEGDFMSIGYFIIDENFRGQSIGKHLEEFATEIARERKCSLIEVYSQKKRSEAHRFYERQGYVVAEKFFNKNLED